MRRGSALSGRKFARATSRWGRSRRRARTSSLRKGSWCARSLARRLWTGKTPSCAVPHALMALSSKVAGGGPNKFKSGSNKDAAYLDGVPGEGWFCIRRDNDEANSQLESASERMKAQRKSLEKRLEEKRAKITAGDDLAPGVLKMVK